MGLIDDIKSESKKSGTNKKKIMYFKDGTKTRIRFLEEIDDGMKVTFHDSYTRGINCVCQETFGRDCPYCGDDDLRTRSQYVWSVYDYESEEVKLLVAAVNNCSPIPGIIAINDAFGTIMDRDIVITKTGKGTDTTYACVHQDKSKFRNPKAKPLSESAILKILDKAYPCEESSDDDEEEYTRSKKRPQKTKTKKDYDDNDNDEEEEEESKDDYSSMTAKQLYNECKKREIECKPRMKQNYYINLLEEDDKANDDWDDEDDEDDEWEEDDE